MQTQAHWRKGPWILLLIQYLEKYNNMFIDPNPFSLSELCTYFPTTTHPSEVTTSENPAPASYMN